MVRSMYGLSECIGPGLAVIEGLLLLETGGHLSELFVMQADLEFLRDVLVLVAVGFVVLTPFWEINCFLH